MLFIHTNNIKYSTVGASFTVSFNVGIDEIPVLMALHDYWAEHNMKGYELKAEQTEPQANADQHIQDVESVESVERKESE